MVGLEDKTPINVPLSFKQSIGWYPGMVLDNVYHFGLKEILKNYTYTEATRIITSIKHHIIKGLK